MGSLASIMSLCMFRSKFYFGGDSTLNVTEETKLNFHFLCDSTLQAVSAVQKSMRLIPLHESIKSQ